jgi:hypothetical protein
VVRGCEAAPHRWVLSVWVKVRPVWNDFCERELRGENGVVVGMYGLLVDGADFLRWWDEDLPGRVELVRLRGMGGTYLDR